jgi:hypothetical protein
VITCSCERGTVRQNVSKFAADQALPEAIKLHEIIQRLRSTCGVRPSVTVEERRQIYSRQQPAEIMQCLVRDPTLSPCWGASCGGHELLDGTAR